MGQKLCWFSNNPGIQHNLENRQNRQCLGWVGASDCWESTFCKWRKGCSLCENNLIYTLVQRVWCKERNRIRSLLLWITVSFEASTSNHIFAEHKSSTLSDSSGIGEKPLDSNKACILYTGTDKAIDNYLYNFCECCWNYFSSSWKGITSISNYLVPPTALFSWIGGSPAWYYRVPWALEERALGFTDWITLLTLEIWKTQLFYSSW